MTLWRHADFLKLWSGQTVSMLGSSVTAIALPLLAVSLLHASVSQMGVLNALGSLPYLTIGLFAGVWIDRLRRRPVLLAADLVLAALLMVVPVAAATGVLRIELLFALAVAVGTASLFFEFAYQAYLPALVPADLLVDGNSKLAQSMSVTRIVGPSVAGFLIQLVTAPLAIAVDAVSYLVSAAALVLIRHREPAPASTGRRHVLRDIREGLAFVFGHPIIGVLAVNNGLQNVCAAMIGATYFVYLARVLELPPAAIGIVLAAGGPGSLVASATASRFARWVGIGPALVYGQLLMVASTAFVVASLVVPAVAVALLAVAAFLVGAGATYYNVTLFSMRQALTPADLRGRTVASVRLLTVGATPIGALIGGFLGDAIGIAATIQIAFAAMLFALLPILTSSVPRLRTVPSA